jgi:hypothetical protein
MYIYFRMNGLINSLKKICCFSKLLFMNSLARNINIIVSKQNTLKFNCNQTSEQAKQHKRASRRSNTAGQLLRGSDKGTAGAWGRSRRLGRTMTRKNR